MCLKYLQLATFIFSSFILLSQNISVIDKNFDMIDCNSVLELSNGQIAISGNVLIDGLNPLPGSPLISISDQDGNLIDSSSYGGLKKNWSLLESLRAGESYVLVA